MKGIKKGGIKKKPQLLQLGHKEKLSKRFD